MSLLKGLELDRNHLSVLLSHGQTEIASLYSSLGQMYEESTIMWLASEREVFAAYHYVNAFINDELQHNEFLSWRNEETEIFFQLCAFLERAARYAF